MSRLGFSK